VCARCVLLPLAGEFSSIGGENNRLTFDISCDLTNLCTSWRIRIQSLGMGSSYRFACSNRFE